jgi:predicted phosphodiesterase
MTTIAYLGDTEPKESGSAGIHELMEDFNHIMEFSPTGVNNVDVIFLVGDASKISRAKEAHLTSDAKNVPLFFVQSNHETESDKDMLELYKTYDDSNIQLNPGPFGTDKTTYSMNIDDFHIVNLNDYWNGKSNDRWFKYGNDGGYITDNLRHWLNTDLSETNKKWKIVLSHEPLYPLTRHVGDSLDRDPENQDEVEQDLINNDVSIFIASHTHYASISTHNNIYHVDCGVAGVKTRDDNTDGFTSIMYTHTHDNGEILKLTWLRENPTWSTPLIKEFDVPPLQSKTCEQISLSMIIE